MHDSRARSRNAPSYRLFIDRRNEVNLIKRLLLRCVQVLSFALNGIWWVLVGWWFNPISQRTENRALLMDVQTHLYFLTSAGQPIIEKHPPILPFDYASAKILHGNVCYCFTRGRGELNVTVAPRHARESSHELSSVIAALDGSGVAPLLDFVDIAAALRPRLLVIDRAFSKECYPEFEKKLR